MAPQLICNEIISQCEQYSQYCLNINYPVNVCLTQLDAVTLSNLEGEHYNIGSREDGTKLLRLCSIAIHKKDWI